MAIAQPLLQSAPTIAEESSIISQLLREQSQLSAVEQFSARRHGAVQGAEGAEPAQARYYQALLPATEPGPGQQYAFEVDLNTCSGCKACVVACHTLNGLEEEESWRKVGTLTIGAELPLLKHVSTACHHCSDPGCLSGCPVKAYDKDPVTGIVKHLDDQCIGCKYCTMMCPYEVPSYSERLGIVRKCDMCQQRLSVGEAPACVQSCPNQAIAIRVVGTAGIVPSAGERLAPGAPVSKLTRPTTRYQGLADEQWQQANSQDAELDRPADCHWPLAVMLVATQASVGLLFAERSASLALWLLTGSGTTSTITWFSTLVASALAAIGLGLAPLHLGQPQRAWRIFLGLRTSWLSREAVLFGNYMGLLSLSLALCWRDYAPESFSAPLLARLPRWAADFSLGWSLSVGVIALVSSGMIYIVTRRHLWRAGRTLGRFLGSAAVVAPLVLATLFVAEESIASIWSQGMIEFLLGVGVIAAATKLAWEWRMLLGGPRSDDSGYDRRSRRLAREALSPLRRLRLIAGVVSIALSALAIGAIGLSFQTAALVLVILAVGTAALGEVFERLLYFSSVVYDRMPGAIH